MTVTVSSDTPVVEAADVRADGERRDGVSVVASSRATRRAAGRRVGVSLVDELLGESWLQRAVAEVRESGGRLTGPDSFLPRLVKEVLEAGLEAELTEHLGYAKHDPAGRGSGNSRNGTTPKTVHTEIGPVDVAVPRDRAGTFVPLLWDNGQFTVLEPPVDELGYALVVNARGDVAGTGFVEKGSEWFPTPWVYRDGTYTILPQLDGYSFQEIADINDRGDILGRGNQLDPSNPTARNMIDLTPRCPNRPQSRPRSG